MHDKISVLEIFIFSRIALEVAHYCYKLQHVQICIVNRYTFWTPHFSVMQILHFYSATACNATHGIAVAILSVCPSVRLSDACIVTKLNSGLRIF